MFLETAHALSRGLTWRCALVLSLATGPALAQGELHGFVEPCTVNNEEDSSTLCEMCSTAPTAPPCKERLGSQGYQVKCTTSVHSEPGQVWCLDTKARDAKTQRRLQFALAGLATAFGAILIVRWVRSRKHTGA